MDIYECIEVAEHNLDGKRPTEKSDRSDKPPVRKTLTVAEAVQRMLKKKGNPT